MNERTMIEPHFVISSSSSFSYTYIFISSLLLVFSRCYCNDYTWLCLYFVVYVFAWLFPYLIFFDCAIELLWVWICFSYYSAYYWFNGVQWTVNTTSCIFSICWASDKLISDVWYKSIFIWEKSCLLFLLSKHCMGKFRRSSHYMCMCGRCYFIFIIYRERIEKNRQTGAGSQTGIKCRTGDNDPQWLNNIK